MSFNTSITDSSDLLRKKGRVSTGLGFFGTAFIASAISLFLIYSLIMSLVNPVRCTTISMDSPAFI